MKYDVSLAGRIARHGDAVEWLDRVMAALESLRGGTTDPSIGGTMDDGQVEIGISVEADDIENAIARATTEIRGALDASGAGHDAIVWQRLVATTAVAAPAR